MTDINALADKAMIAAGVYAWDVAHATRDGRVITPETNQSRIRLRAAIDALRDAAAVPAGWRLVPIEFTEEMFLAAANTPCVQSGILRDAAMGLPLPDWAFKNGGPYGQIYRAMIEAAPPSPQAEIGDAG